MVKSKWVSILSASALALSLMVPAAAAPAEAATTSTTKAEWNSERYGDRVDIDQTLNDMAQDEAFMKQADKKIKAQANDVAASDAEAAADGPFTYDGGTKLFLDRNLSFKEFTLRSVGDNVEIWVANDLAY